MLIGVAKEPSISPSTRSQQRSGRYTPPLDRQLRLRPVWHRAVGVILVVVGIEIFMVNDFTRALPGGHSEGYAVVAIFVAGSSTWFFGLFDRFD